MDPNFISVLIQDIKLKHIPQYLYATLLMVGADLVILIGDRYLFRLAFPWATISLLAISITVILWGVGPAVWSLVLAIAFGDIVTPHVHISYFLTGQYWPWEVRFTRTLIFSICGIIIIFFVQWSKNLKQKSGVMSGVIRALQTMTIPTNLPNIPGWDLACRYIPAVEDENVGGDFYDVFPLNSNRSCFGVLLGDVTGKGKEAAANTAALRFGTRSLLRIRHSPGDVLGMLNDMLLQEEMLPATLFIGVLNINECTLTYASAGHEPPILVHSNGQSDRLQPTGCVLGIEGESYSNASISIEQDDVLILFTDGVSEIRSHLGKFLPETELLAYLTNAGAEPTATETILTLLNSINRFCESKARDDIAILVMRCLAPIPASVTAHR